MIGPTFVVAVVAGVIVAVRRYGRPGRVTTWSLWALGVLAVVFVVAAVVPSAGSTLFFLRMILVGLAVAAVVAWVTARLPRRRLASWADAHGVDLTDTNTAFVTAYVTEGHRLRLVCGFGGAIALAAVSRGLGIEVPVSGWVWLMAGYLGGVVWSEAWLTRLPAGTIRTASLTPRRVGDYLVGRLRIAQVVVPCVALLLGGAAFAVSGKPPTDSVEPRLTALSVGALRWTVAMIGVASVALSLGVAWLQRHLVTKPQPTADTDLITADEAVRASSVHLLSGTAVGIVLVCIGSQLTMLYQLGAPGEGLLTLGSLLCWLAGLVAWRYYGHRAWVVRRHRRPQTLARGLEEVGI